MYILLAVLGELSNNIVEAHFIISLKLCYVAWNRIYFTKFYNTGSCFYCRVAANWERLSWLWFNGILNWSSLTQLVKCICCVYCLIHSVPCNCNVRLKSVCLCVIEWVCHTKPSSTLYRSQLPLIFTRLPPILIAHCFW